jgi:hypothetical protein
MDAIPQPFFRHDSSAGQTDEHGEQSGNRNLAHQLFKILRRI